MSVRQAATLLPEGALVGLITFGGSVQVRPPARAPLPPDDSTLCVREGLTRRPSPQVHELGFQGDVCKQYVFRGDLEEYPAEKARATRPATQDAPTSVVSRSCEVRSALTRIRTLACPQIRGMLGLGGSVQARPQQRGGQAPAPMPGGREALGRFLVPARPPCRSHPIPPFYPLSPLPRSPLHPSPRPTSLTLSGPVSVVSASCQSASSPWTRSSRTSPLTLSPGRAVRAITAPSRASRSSASVAAQTLGIPSRRHARGARAVPPASLVTSAPVSPCSQPPAGQRAGRATGAALAIATALVEAAALTGGARLMLFVAGAVTVGPGMVVNKPYTEALRSHKARRFFRVLCALPCRLMGNHTPATPKA